MQNKILIILYFIIIGMISVATIIKITNKKDDGQLSFYISFPIYDLLNLIGTMIIGVIGGLITAYYIF